MERSTAKLDKIRAIEREVQEDWAKHKVFEVDPPADFKIDENSLKNARDDKYFATFPYPYMNGRLHLGHTFTLSKVEVITFINCSILFLSKNTLSFKTVCYWL